MSSLSPASSALLQLLRSAWLYTVLWVSWFTILWFLSNAPLPAPPIQPQIPIDKVLHWGYYGIGGALSCFALLAWRRAPRLTAGAVEFLLILGFCVGWLDEWHQSWYEFRSGNDMGDLIADCVGTYCGVKVAALLWHRWLSPR